MFNEIFKRKPVAIILCLKDEQTDWYPSKLAKYSGASYVYTTKFLDQLQKIGLIQYEKKEKTKIVKLTDNGKVIAALISDINERINKIKEKEDEKNKQAQQIDKAN
jgi:predicted transcriptional regulator